MVRLSRRDLALLALLTIFWGVNWPVMKFGVAEMPPLFFRAVCIAGGLVFMWAWARATGVPLTVPRGAWPSIVKLAVPNVMVWHLLAIVALKMLPSGRAAILGYTMPVWAVVFGLLLFKEKPLTRHWIGVAAALAGTLLLLSSEFTKLAGSPLGTLLMRRNLTSMPTIALTFWMLVLTLAAVSVASAAFEMSQWRWPLPLEWVSIVYNMAIAIAFCHVVWSMLARNLPPAASGLSVMMIPVVGVFSGMLMLGEEPHWQDYAALALILLALSTVLLPSRTRD
jgi:drug/metabolite transporter (DMT)-like permease